MNKCVLCPRIRRVPAFGPAATYVPLDRVSHFALWQDPEQMNAVLAEFLK